jgi:hypothetical protein
MVNVIFTSVNNVLTTGAPGLSRQEPDKQEVCHIGAKTGVWQVFWNEV